MLVWLKNLHLLWQPLTPKKDPRLEPLHLPMGVCHNDCIEKCAVGETYSLTTKHMKIPEIVKFFLCKPAATSNCSFMKKSRVLYGFLTRFPL